MKFFLRLLGGNDSTSVEDSTTTTGGDLGAKTEDLKAIVNTIQTVVSAALGIITAGVIILSIFIAYKFFTAETEDKRKNAKAQLIYAIIGVVVLLALMALAPALTKAIGNSLNAKN